MGCRLIASESDQIALVAAFRGRSTTRTTSGECSPLSKTLATDSVLRRQRCALARRRRMQRACTVRWNGVSISNLRKRLRSYSDGEARMNIREIAKRANVSISTVSRTINRHQTVDPKLAKRVWKVIEEIV